MGSIPALLSASIHYLIYATVYRLTMSGVCICAGSRFVFTDFKTRLGMKIAGAFNRDVAESLGINIKLIHATVFALLGLASVAGMIAAPIAIYPISRPQSADHVL
jgi:branched-chain amino acid transport system permease protein